MFEDKLTLNCLCYGIFELNFSRVFQEGTEVPGAAEAPEAPDEEEPPEEDVEQPAEEAKEKGKVMIEAGAKIPIPPSSSEAGPDKVEEVDAVGAEVVARYVLTDPTKPYIALTFPLSVDYRSISLVGTGATVSSELADEVTVTGGVGVEGGLPLGDVVTLYGGAGIEGGVQVYDYVYADDTGAASGGTDVSPAFAAFGTAGLRVNPTSAWHLYAGVKPTVSFTGGPAIKVPVVVGTGLTF